MQVQATQQPTTAVPAPPPPPGQSAAAMLEAARAQRRELDRQLSQLTDQREDLARQLMEGRAGSDEGAKAIQARIAALDGRIAALDPQIAQSDARIAQLSGIPGAVQTEEPAPNMGPPDWVIGMSFVFMFCVVFPLVIAVSRRIWKRGSPAPAAGLTPELKAHMARLEQAVDTIAVEIERVSEGQRFLTKIFAEGGSGRALGAGAAQPVEVKQGEGVKVRPS